jgi:hypothetical protein
MVAAPLLLAFAAATNTVASSECRPPKDSSEAKLLAFFAAPIAFSPAGHAERMAPGAVRLSVDLTYVPKPGANISRASFCNRKSENTELSPVFPRLRIAVGLPAGLFVEGSYLPPVTVMDATPNLGSIALGWSRALATTASGGSTWLTLRAHATVGDVSGPITCSKDAIQSTQPNAACYGTKVSDDTYAPNVLGGEAMLGWTGKGRFAAYAGAGYNDLSPRFQVNFTRIGGTVDNTKVVTDDSRIAAFVGGRYRLSPRTALTAELYSVPKDLTTIRVGGSWTVRGTS